MKTAEEKLFQGIEAALFSAYLTGQNNRKFKTWYKENEIKDLFKSTMEEYHSLQSSKDNEETVKAPFLGWTNDKDILHQQREYWGAMNGVKKLQQRIAELEKALKN